MFWFFGHEACGILAPRPGIEPVPPAFEGEVLTTGLPGKSLATFNICSSDRLKLCVRRNRERVHFAHCCIPSTQHIVWHLLGTQKIYSEWNFFPYFQTMVQLLGALTGCVQHVCATQESIILENIHSLPSSVLHVIKSTFVHCKVSDGSKYTLFFLNILKNFCLFFSGCVGSLSLCAGFL